MHVSYRFVVSTAICASMPILAMMVTADILMRQRSKSRRESDVLGKSGSIESDGPDTPEPNNPYRTVCPTIFSPHELPEEWKKEQKKGIRDKTQHKALSPPKALDEYPHGLLVEALDESPHKLNW